MVNTQYWNFCLGTRWLESSFLRRIIQGGIWAFIWAQECFFPLSLAMGVWRGCREETQHPPSVPEGVSVPWCPGPGITPETDAFGDADVCVSALKKKKKIKIYYGKKKENHQNSCGLDSWSGSWWCEGLLKYLCYLLFNFILFFFFFPPEEFGNGLIK